MELASGEVAAPASPMAPARESGVINKKGTAVERVLRFCPNRFWAVASREKKQDRTNDSRIVATVFIKTGLTISGKRTEKRDYYSMLSNFSCACLL